MSIGQVGVVDGTYLLADFDIHFAVINIENLEESGRLSISRRSGQKSLLELTFKGYFWFDRMSQPCARIRHAWT